MVDHAREQQVARYLDWVLERRTIRRPHVSLDVERRAGPPAIPLATLLRDPNVVGLGVAEKVTRGEPTGDVAFTLYVRQKLPPAALGATPPLPHAVLLLDDTIAPTDVIEFGEVFLQASGSSGAVRAGATVQANGGPGTVTGLVARAKLQFVLTNRHVLAPRGAVGPVAVKCPAGRAVVGTVAEIAPLKRGRDFLNVVDAGLVDVQPARRSDVSLDAPFGKPKSSIEPRIGMRVEKLGASSNTTSSEVLDAHFAVFLEYPGVGVIGFRDQIKCRPFTEGGDSGAMVWDADSKAAIGVNFAGNSEGSLANPIGSVLRELEVDLLSGS